MNVLICPLNWGLGHASRCVPVIRLLQKSGHNVIIAADKGPLAFLQKAFPELEFVRFPGFEPEYSRRDTQVWKFISMIPRALVSFHREHQTLKRILRYYSIDMIISDNRFGCWNARVKSIYMTHQLHIQMPKYWRWASFIVNGIHRMYMCHYDEIWVPDVEDEKESLAGSLSHPPIGKKTRYIGLKSRFENNADVLEDKKRDVLWLSVMSGPEPQRTMFENLVIEKARTVHGKVVILRALPDSSEEPSDLPPNVTVFNHVNDEMFVSLVRRSEVIICRGGYTSLMDLAALNRKAFLVPTPGQTEQEYLAEYLSDKGFRWCRQKEFLQSKIIFKKKFF